MSDEPRIPKYQDNLQAGAMFSTIQPAIYFRSGIRAGAIAEFFTSPEALGYVRLRKEGDGYVRN